MSSTATPPATDLHITHVNAWLTSVMISGLVVMFACNSQLGRLLKCAAASLMAQQCHCPSAVC